MTTYQLRAATPLRWLGGQIDIRVEIDTGLIGAFGLWDSAQWDQDVWGSRDPAWFDITEFCETINTNQGTETWGNRFEAGSMSILVSNIDGRFTPDSGIDPFHLPFRPGRRIRVVALPDPDHTTSEDKKPLFTGYIDSTQDAYDEGGYLITTTLTCLDYMALWGQHNPTALETPTGVQTTSERVHAALDRFGWPMGGRDIQTGVHTMQTSHLAQSTLEECARAADAEGGQFFCSFDGKATFKARDWLDTDARSITVQGYLGYDPADIDLAAPVVDKTAFVEAVIPNWDRARVVNLVEFARVGSTMQLVEDLDSQSAYDVRTYRRTDLENNSDAEVLFLAERHLDRFKDSRLRIESITIAAVADPDNEDRNRMMFDTQFGDLLAVNIQTPYGWNITKGVKVAGISHFITANDWQVTFKLDDILGEAEIPIPTTRFQTDLPLTIYFGGVLGSVEESLYSVETDLAVQVSLSGVVEEVIIPVEEIESGLVFTVSPGFGELVAIPDEVETSIPLTVDLGGELFKPVITRPDLMTTLAPEAWWKFNSASDLTDQGAGTHTLDYTSNGNPTTFVGGAIVGETNSVDFNNPDNKAPGTSISANVLDPTTLRLRQNMSIEAWVRPDPSSTSPSTPDRIFSGYVTSPSKAYLYALHYVPSTRTFRFLPGSGSTTYSTADIVVPGISTVWSHVVYTVEWTASDRVIRGYLNGVEISSQTTTFKPTSQSYGFDLASELPASIPAYFNGRISELAIFPKVLSPAEVTALYEATY